jgi:hypothetical protein
MPLILFDQNTPRQLRRALIGHEVRTALQMGWDSLANGELIEAAENGGFDVMVSADQNLRYQQNLVGRRLALVVLTTNHWDDIRPYADRVAAAVNGIQPVGYVTVAFDRPPLRRRPFNPSFKC